MASFFGLHNLYLQLIVNTWRTEGKVEASVSKGGWDLSIQIYILFAFKVHIVFLQKAYLCKQIEANFFYIESILDAQNRLHDVNIQGGGGSIKGCFHD